MLKKLAYSFGSAATALSYQSFSAFIIFFYVDVVKLPVYLAGIAMLVFAIWNALNDPAAGYISDLTHTRWGRRIPYILFGAIPFGLSYWLLWNPPFTDIYQDIPLFIYFVFAICLFDAFFTITSINWSALFPEMYASLKERAEVNSYRQLFWLFGLLLGVALPPVLASQLGWGSVGLVIGLMIPIILFIAVWGSHEQLQFERDKPLPLFKALAATLKNRSFLTFVLANLLIQYTLTTILAGTPFFIKYILQAPPRSIALIVAAAFLAALPMLFVWRRIEVRHGAKRTFLLAAAMLALALSPLLFVTGLKLTIMMAALVGAALSGFVMSADLLLSDIIDEDEINTGRRREGMFFGLNAFIIRFAILLEVASMGLIFVRFGYSPYVHTQVKEFLVGLRILMAGLPLIALGLACLAIMAYPLSGKRLTEMDDQLLELHKKKGTA